MRPSIAPLLLACACSAGKAGPEPPASYDRTAVGDQATYRVTPPVGSPFSQIVTVTESTATGFKRSVSGGASQVNVVQTRGTGEYLASSGAAIYDPPAVILPAATAAGTVESTTSTVTSATGTSTVVRTATVEGEEQVVVPAGTFQALKVTTVITSSAGFGTSLTDWWAPGVGRVKTRATPSATPSSVTTSELVAFAAPPTFSPPQGVYAGAQPVTLASITPDASLRYTTDGSEPGLASPRYAGPVQVSGQVTLKVVPEVGGRLAGPSASARYLTWSGGSVEQATSCAALAKQRNQLRLSCGLVHPGRLQDPLADPGCAEMAAEVVAGRVRYDATAAAACLAAVQPLGCGDVDPSGELRLPPACDGVLTGMVAMGEPCNIDQDCASRACSFELVSVCPAYCTTPGGGLVACTSDQECGSRRTGFACDTAASPPTCVPGSRVGDPCPCLPGLWCDTGGTSPTCAAPAPAGAACGGAVTCAFGTVCLYACLASDPSCGSFGTGTCLSVVGGGGACTPDGAPCADGYRCGEAGTCDPWPSVGQPCDGAAACLGGGCNIAVTPPMCVTSQPLGAYCATAEQCASWFCHPSTQRCDSPTCVP